MSDRATHCPSCGATVHSITRESGGRWSLGCGDWITDQQAVQDSRDHWQVWHSTKEERA